MMKRVNLMDFIKKYFACIYLIIFSEKQNKEFKKKSLIKHLFKRNNIYLTKFPTSAALYCEI